MVSYYGYEIWNSNNNNNNNIYIVQINIQEDMIKCALHIKIESKFTIVTHLQFWIYNKMWEYILYEHKKNIN